MNTLLATYRTHNENACGNDRVLHQPFHTTEGWYYRTEIKKSAAVGPFDTEAQAREDADFDPAVLRPGHPEDVDRAAREGTPARKEQVQRAMERARQLFTPEFHPTGGRDGESLRDYLHTNKLFYAFPSREEALAFAHKQIEEDIAGRDPEDHPEGLPVLEMWSRHPEGDNEEYDDGGVWYRLSDGEEGRVVIHIIELGAS